MSKNCLQENAQKAARMQKTSTLVGYQDSLKSHFLPKPPFKLHKFVFFSEKNTNKTLTKHKDQLNPFNDLGRRVNPDGRVEQDVITQLLE